MAGGRRVRPVSEQQSNDPSRPKSRGFLLISLVASAGLIIAGLGLPALHISSFGLLNDEASILGSIEAFREDGQVFLAGLLYVVSVVFPMLKIILALILTLSFNVHRRRAHWIADALAELARWSMTDVFILAVAVMVIDAKLISSADLLPGAYLFAAGVILSALAVHVLRRSLKKHARAMQQSS